MLSFLICLACLSPICSYMCIEDIVMLSTQVGMFLQEKIEWCGKVSFSAYFTNFIGAFIFPWGMQALLHHYGYSISGNLLFVLLLIPIFVITFLLVPPVDYIIAYMKRIGKIVIKEDINGC